MQNLHIPLVIVTLNRLADCLFCSLSPVTLPAKHLAVFYYRSAAFAPRCDVVALHKFIVELLAAYWADMLLLFPHRQFNVFGECAEVEVALVARQYVRDDALLPLYLAIKMEIL